MFPPLLPAESMRRGDDAHPGVGFGPFDGFCHCPLFLKMPRLVRHPSTLCAHLFVLPRYALALPLHARCASPRTRLGPSACVCPPGPRIARGSARRVSQRSRQALCVPFRVRPPTPIVTRAKRKATGSRVGGRLRDRHLTRSKSQTATTYSSEQTPLRWRPPARPWRRP